MSVAAVADAARAAMGLERRDFTFIDVSALRAAHSTILAARDYLWITRIDSERGHAGRILPRARADLQAFSILHLLAIDLAAELEGR